MIQSIYSSVSNADLVSGKKGSVITSDPIPLLRDNFLGEYRTELEKAKVRKNLGIPDENSLSWGNIEGFVESQKDLVEYVESKWNYSTELNGQVTNIKDAMDYALYFVTNFKGEHESIVAIQETIQTINSLLNELNNSVNSNSTSISEIESNITSINDSITQLNNSLLNINVDSKILSWIENKLNNSNALILNEESINIKISEKENNAVILDEGVYVKDFTADIERNTQSIESINSNMEGITIYTTTVPDGTKVPTQVGGIKVNTLVEDLKGKTISQIIDTILFPTVVRDLIYPSVYYTSISTLVEVGSPIIRPTLVFVQGDAGLEVSRVDELTFEDQLVFSQTYDELGTYKYHGSVTYEEGEELVDNKGNVVPGHRIPAGTKQTNVSVITTYPWYVDGDKQSLILFNVESNYIEFVSSGQTSIKLPGKNSTLISFKVDGGLGFTDVEMSGWTKTEQEENGIVYVIWTKNESYTSTLRHQIKFKLLS